MSVRTRHIKHTVRIEEIVETEYIGVHQLPNKREAERILENGIYLGEPKAQTVALRYYKKLQYKHLANGRYRRPYPENRDFLIQNI